MRGISEDIPCALYYLSCHAFKSRAGLAGALTGFPLIAYVTASLHRSCANIFSTLYRFFILSPVPRKCPDEGKPVYVLRFLQKIIFLY